MYSGRGHRWTWGEDKTPGWKYINTLQYICTPDISRLFVAGRICNGNGHLHHSLLCLGEFPSHDREEIDIKNMKEKKKKTIYKGDYEGVLHFDRVRLHQLC